MSFLAGLAKDVRQIKKDLADIVNLQQTIIQGFNTMSEKGEALKQLIADLGNDVTEIDGDLQEIIDKLGELSSNPTPEEVAEITASLVALKERTRAAADKVAEPGPEPEPEPEPAE
jgi:uncharacterized protein YoxC